MKLEASALLGILTGPSRVASRRTTLPVLNCILLGTSAGKLVATATDLDVWLERTMAVPNPSETLPYVCVNAQRLFNCVRSATGEITMEVKGHKLIVSGAGWTQSLGVLDEKEFPKRPVDMGLTGFDIDPLDLADTIEAVAWCVDQMDLVTTQWARTILIKPGKNTIKAEAFKRVLYTSYSKAAKCEPMEPFIVPGAQAAVICEALRADGAMIDHNKKRVTVVHDGGLVSALLPECEWPDTDKVTKQKASQIGTVDGAALLDALLRITSIHSDEKSAKTLVMKDNSIEITSRTATDSCDETVRLSSDPGGQFQFFCDAFLWLKAMERFEAGPVELRLNDVQLFMEQDTRTTILSLMRDL